MANNKWLYVLKYAFLWAMAVGVFMFLASLLLGRFEIENAEQVLREVLPRFIFAIPFGIFFALSSWKNKNLNKSS